MLDALNNSSLPIEYELKYGTACGNLDIAQLMSKAASDSICGIYGGFAEKEILGVLWTNSSPLPIDGFDPLLIGLHRR